MSCPPYNKIDTLFNRDEKFKVRVGDLRRPEFAIPQRWVVTEKIDGTNVRVSLEQDCDTADPMHECKGKWVVRFYGRTENSQMPTFLFEHLQKTFTLEKMQKLWRCKPSCEAAGKEPGREPYLCPDLEPYPITLYGEGYGAKIQSGGDYRKDGVSFRLFDVLIGDTWLKLDDVGDVAYQLSIKPVPLLGVYDTDEIVDMVQLDFASPVSFMESVELGGPARYAEGIVAFTDPPLFNSRGKRLTFKLKTKDF